MIVSVPPNCDTGDGLLREDARPPVASAGGLALLLVLPLWG
jgi:hypothetical protein